MIHTQKINHALSAAQMHEGQQMIVGILIIFLVIVVALVIGHLVTAGPEREMAAAVQRHVDELNNRYVRIFQSESQD